MYPEGPFGIAEGDTLEALSFVTDTDEAYDLDTDIYADEGKKLLLLTTAAGWCVACIEEQAELEQLHGEHEAAGLAIIVSYFEDSQFQPATPTDAADWRETHGLTVDVITDTEFKLSDYYDETATPMNMLVDIDRMEILSINTGWDPGLVRAVIDARLSE